MARMMFLKRTARLMGLGLGLVSTVPATAEAHKGSSSAQSGEKGVTAVLLVDKLAELITTTGTATISVPPDGVRISLGVEVQSKTAAQARNELARRTQSVTQAIEAIGEKNLTLRTSLLQIEPVFSQATPNRPARVVGFRAQNTLTLTLQNVATQELGNRAATLVDTSVKAGANVVQGISFLLSRAEEAQGRALKLAVQDAEKNARTIATSLNLTIVKAHSIEGAPEASGQISHGFFAAAKFEGVPTPIEPGEIKVSASVTAKFHFTKE